MQVVYALAEVLGQAQDFLLRFDNPTPPTLAEIHTMRGHVIRALGLFKMAQQLDSDHIRLEEINQALKTPGPDAAKLVAERKEINARILASIPRPTESETVTLQERHQRPEPRIEDEPDASFLQGGIDVGAR